MILCWLGKNNWLLYNKILKIIIELEYLISKHVGGGFRQYSLIFNVNFRDFLSYDHTQK